jgi:eukaryotic-like serine/threonine-protein kinase
MTGGPAESPELDQLAAFGEFTDAELQEALHLFAQLRRTPHERRAIDLLVARDARSPLPEPLLIALASALLDRGDPSGALRALARTKSPTGLMIQADLAAEAGDVSKAVALVEQVLLRDIDWPGAMERRARWKGACDAVSRAPQARAWDTVVANAPDAPFELLREVGRGGAAVVYEAADRLLGRRVALKVYHQLDRDRAQLQHETHVAVLLAGPGIVRVIDVDLSLGWLALEWAPLGTVAALIRARRADLLLPVGRWATPLAVALARVHERGWVHHDVKPANVALRSPDAPILTDFGIARRVGEPSPAGSTGYLSPERRAGRASDPRDDIYGYGRVLEDALEACAAAGCADDVTLRPWRALAASCIGPDERRPRVAADLLTRSPGGASSSCLT